MSEEFEPDPLIIKAIVSAINVDELAKKWDRVWFNLRSDGVWYVATDGFAAIAVFAPEESFDVDRDLCAKSGAALAYSEFPAAVTLAVREADHDAPDVLGAIFEMSKMAPAYAPHRVDARRLSRLVSGAGMAVDHVPVDEHHALTVQSHGSWKRGGVVVSSGRGKTKVIGVLRPLRGN